MSALTPQRRLLNALSDPLLEPLLQQHFRRVCASELRTVADTLDFTVPERDLLRQAANMLKKGIPSGVPVHTVVLSEQQRMILESALGQVSGADALQLAAILRVTP